MKNKILVIFFSYFTNDALQDVKMRGEGIMFLWKCVCHNTCNTWHASTKSQKTFCFFCLFSLPLQPGTTIIKLRVTPWVIHGNLKVYYKSIHPGWTKERKAIQHFFNLYSKQARNGILHTITTTPTNSNGNTITTTSNVTVIMILMMILTRSCWMTRNRRWKWKDGADVEYGGAATFFLPALLLLNKEVAKQIRYFKRRMRRKVRNCTL